MRGTLAQPPLQFSGKFCPKTQHSLGTLLFSNWAPRVRLSGSLCWAFGAPGRFVRCVCHCERCWKAFRSPRHGGSRFFPVHRGRRVLQLFPSHALHLQSLPSLFNPPTTTSHAPGPHFLWNPWLLCAQPAKSCPGFWGELLCPCRDSKSRHCPSSHFIETGEKTSPRPHCRQHCQSWDTAPAQPHAREGTWQECWQSLGVMPRLWSCGVGVRACARWASSTSRLISVSDTAPLFCPVPPPRHVLS